MGPLAQGRFIVHRAGLTSEQWHEISVDLEGLQCVEGSDAVKHGTFADVAARLRRLRDGGAERAPCRRLCAACAPGCFRCG